jgi:hypothetical protein
MELHDYLPSGWVLKTTHDGLMLTAPDYEQGKDFVAGAARYLYETAQNIRGVIEIHAATGDRLASITPNKSVKGTGELDSDPSNIETLRKMQLEDARLMDRILTSSDPMAMVGLTDHIQVLINQPMATRLGTTCKAARGRNLRPLHNHGWLPELLQTLQQQGQVRVRYQSWLNAQDEVYGELTTLFEVRTFQDEPVRIATNIDLNIIQPPTMEVVRV